MSRIREGGLRGLGAPSHVRVCLWVLPPSCSGSPHNDGAAVSHCAAACNRAATGHTSGTYYLGPPILDYGWTPAAAPDDTVEDIREITVVGLCPRIGSSGAFQMHLYVAITDSDWFQLLSRRAPDEVNFWQPSGGTQFRALTLGEPLLPGVSWRLPSAARYRLDASAIAQFLGLGNWLILKVRVSSPDCARDAIDLVAATVDAPTGVIEHAIFGEDLFDGRAPTPGIVFIVKIAGQQGGYAIGDGLLPPE